MRRSGCIRCVGGRTSAITDPGAGQYATAKACAAKVGAACAVGSCQDAECTLLAVQARAIVYDVAQCCILRGRSARPRDIQAFKVALRPWPALISRAIGDQLPAAQQENVITVLHAQGC